MVAKYRIVEQKGGALIRRVCFFPIKKPGQPVRFGRIKSESDLFAIQIVHVQSGTIKRIRYNATQKLCVFGPAGQERTFAPSGLFRYLKELAGEKLARKVDCLLRSVTPAEA